MDGDRQRHAARFTVHVPRASDAKKTVAQHQPELERRLRAEPDTRLLKTAVAFANGRGGRILFGVDSDMTVVGMGDGLFGAKGAIADAITNRIAPMVLMTTGVTTIDNKPIIALR